MTKYKIINKTYSPLKFTSLGVIPARGSIEVYKVPDEMRAFQKKNMIEIKKVSN
jgi:hypothetical protein